MRTEFVFGLVVILTIILEFVAKKKIVEQQKRQEGKDAPKSPAVREYYAMHPGNGGQKRIRAHTGGRLLAKTMEDRNNDWLARQLREEKVAQAMVSEMFSLKQEHILSCDAEGVVDDPAKKS